MRGNNLDSVRRNNLSIVLDIVNRQGAVARAGVTRATGLNRSTVAAIVGRLVELRLVVESEPETPASVGRPSPMINPDPACVAIAVNPELDAVTVAIVGLGGRVIARLRNPVDHAITAAETGEIVGRMLRTLQPELATKRVMGLGVAVPGLVRASDGLVRWAPHLDWTDEPIATILQTSTGYRTFVSNDASVGAVAEHIFGAGIGVGDMIYLNGGASGIGGGVIASGVLLGGAGGFAGEFGQNRPGIRSAADRTTTDGTLEDEVSRSRLLAAVALEEADETTLALALDGSADAAVLDELSRQARVLSVALSNAVNVLNPELIVLGGFLAAVLRSDPDGLAALVAAQSTGPSAEGVSIVPAALGADLMLIGAAQLVFDELVADPEAYATAAAPGAADSGTVDGPGHNGVMSNVEVGRL